MSYSQNIKPDITHPPLPLKNQPFVRNSTEIHKGRIIERAHAYPNYYRIVLRSKDIVLGTKTDATFRLSFPDRLHGTAVLMVESFNLQDKDTASNLAKEVIELRSRTLIQSRSYDTTNDGLSDLLCSFTGYSYQSQSPSADGAGVPVTDANIFENQNFNVYFKKVDETAFTTNEFKGDWVLTLLVIPYDHSINPYD